MGDLTDTLSPPSTTPPAAAHSRPLPVREDCWSEDATSTLIDAWGRRYLELNRGNLRQKDWQDVADAVNALHGHTKKTHRTDVQCKNRIDTIKKKYKIEKARVSSSDGTLASSWPFFERLDPLIGSNVSIKKPPPQPSPSLSPSPPVAVPLYNKKTAPSPSTALVVLPQKRTASAMDEGFFRRNYSAMAAAAAASAEDDVEDEDEEEEERESEEVEEREGMRRLARAIETFGEVYERVEREKLMQMVELEKQRMQFAKDLEVQRMNMFMDTQVQLEKIKRGKRSRSNDLYS
ncbi:trihelix transcription factor ASIL1-like [Juglans microcarpa x Juglans regia]|uniref:trihelix transcription factor ASIL1-like n=1 Tax=Juglans microcarpa x Juglans regia TaxID=2249226 RepID=UPI001B7EC92D|nr:trihelix transcription factor ASIL1-like [Juglans microcarpa x Juglans regia]